MRTVVVVAGGPSVTLSAVRVIGKARSLSLCSVIAVNDAVYPCWFADIAFASDKRWWEANLGIPGFRGEKIGVEMTPFEDVSIMMREKNEVGQPVLDGYDPRPGYIRTGHNSGYGAVHLAAGLGATRIIILGFDFTSDGAREHWFGYHDGPMDKHSNTDTWRRLFHELTDELERRGVEVLNASKRSTITWLPKYDINKLQDEIWPAGIPED